MQNKIELRGVCRGLLHGAALGNAKVDHSLPRPGSRQPGLQAWRTEGWEENVFSAEPSQRGAVTPTGSVSTGFFCWSSAVSKTQHLVQRREMVTGHTLFLGGGSWGSNSNLKLGHYKATIRSELMFLLPSNLDQSKRCGGFHYNSRHMGE